MPKQVRLRAYLRAPKPLSPQSARGSCPTLGCRCDGDLVVHASVTFPFKACRLTARRLLSCVAAVAHPPGKHLLPSGTCRLPGKLPTDVRLAPTLHRGRDGAAAHSRRSVRWYALRQWHHPGSASTSSQPWQLSCPAAALGGPRSLVFRSENRPGQCRDVLGLLLQTLPPGQHAAGECLPASPPQSPGLPPLQCLGPVATIICSQPTHASIPNHATLASSHGCTEAAPHTL